MDGLIKSNEMELIGNFDYDQERTTKHGINKLELMAEFISVIEGKKVESNYNRFKSWLVEKLQRGLTLGEEERLLKGIVAYIQSEVATNERTKTMNFLFNTEFLED